MPRFVLPLFRDPARHAYRLLKDPAYRTLCRLTSRYARHPRFVPAKLRLHEWDLLVPDVASFLSAYEAIFVNRIYDFRAEADQPYIIDCGANIGLGTLFFKMRYPRAKIVAFEPDPKIAEAFKHNVHGNGFDDVELIEKAAWTSETTLKFSSEGADGGRIDSVTAAGGGRVISVPTARLRDFLYGREIDFLKIDIEGAEVDVVPDCADALGGVRRAFVEHHSFVSKPQRLARTIGAFEEQGFRVTIESIGVIRAPLLGRSADYLGMDHHLNIFFDRQDDRGGGGASSI